MANVDLQLLLEGSKCYTCLGVSLVDALNLALFARILGELDMSAIATSSLVEEAKCYQCFGPLTVSQMLTLAINRRTLLALNESADVTPQGLVDYAKCYACYGASMFDLMELALLDQISQAL